MDMMKSCSNFLKDVTELGLMLVALGIVLGILVGNNVPFLGNIVGNLVELVRSLGDNGLVGLIALGIIVWLFQRRSHGHA